MSLIEHANGLQKELYDLTKILAKLKEQMKKDRVDERIEDILDYNDGLRELNMWAGQIHYYTDASSSARNLEVTRYNSVREADKNRIVNDAVNGFVVYKKKISEFLARLTEVMEKAKKLHSTAAGYMQQIYSARGALDSEVEAVYSISESILTELTSMHRQASALLEKLQNIPNLERQEMSLVHRYMREITNSSLLYGAPERGKYQTDAQIRYMKEIEQFTSGRISSGIFMENEVWIKRRLEALGVKSEETDLKHFDLDNDADMKRAKELSILAYKFPKLFPGWYNNKGEFLWDLYWEKRVNSSVADRLKRGAKRVIKRAKGKMGIQQRKQNSSR